MKKRFIIFLLTALCGASAAPARAQTKAAGDYASDVGVVVDAQGQALGQARQALEKTTGEGARKALETAIKEMERSRGALEAAKNSPEKLGAAIAAEEAAYQALLKATPREYRMNRSRKGGKSGQSGQPSEQEMSQLEMNAEDSRYETESQAAGAPSAQQQEQAQTVDRLKQLARRQQDLNDRLRDLQNALQEAKTDPERQEIQRQLKRLRDEERQELSDVDELRQKMEQSPEAAKQAAAREQLERTHTDVQKAAQELENQSVSEALAAGSRAEENLQNLRENLRQQSSSQFSQQMRQMRQEARDLAEREDQIAHSLDALNNAPQKSLDDAAPRQAVVEQMARQQIALTNILGEMKSVTEQAEATEPLLSKQLYDTIRRADQAHTDNQLDVGSRLTERGFLPQAAQAEQAARQSIDELKKDVDRAAESVLGSETEALRHAQKELNDLAGQLAMDMAARTNDSPAGKKSQGNSTGSDGDKLRQFAQELGTAGGAGGLGANGPITGNNYVDWTDRMRDVEQTVDSQEVRNQLATARERVGVYRRAYRQSGQLPPPGEMRDKALAPLTLARDWVGEELARAQNDRSLTPLDRDPTPDKYSDLVRKYYEKLGSPK